MPTPSTPGPRLAVDIGGTFTDLVLETAQGRRALKLLTTPAAPELAVLEGVRQLLRQARLAAGEIQLFLHGTTLATNAVIERKGARTALIATEGFRDILEIADEGRYDQYDLQLEKPKPLVPAALRFTLPERVDAKGQVLKPLDPAALEALLPRLRAAAVESLAIAFLHSYANPAHEIAVAERIAAALPGLWISRSSEVCPEIREYERTSTTVANAYVQPVMASYLGRLATALTGIGLACPVFMMTSGGGLTTLETARRLPVRLVESGPAGGALLAARLAKELGLDRVLSFDMGGTTAKICIIADGQPQVARAFLKGSGLPLRIPVIEMVEIGAGGGSLAGVDALGRITVGPESAASVPGPACYGRGGTRPAVTDADLVLGRLAAEGFADGLFDLRPDLARQALLRHVGEPQGLAAEEAALGVSEVVDETMASAARVHAVESGATLAGHTMIAFGGAAPLHAARLAEKLDIERIVIPADAGVGSALGFLAAPVAFELLRSFHLALEAAELARVNPLLEALRAEALALVEAGDGRGGEGGAIEEKRVGWMRYRGQGSEIPVALPARALAAADEAPLRAAFEQVYRRLFERVIPGAPIEVLSWSVTLGRPAPTALPLAEPPPAGSAAPTGQRRLLDARGRDWVEARTYRRERLAPGQRLVGPALVEEANTTTLVPPGFAARLGPAGHLILERQA
jgi:N-methylhydantoinase A